MILPPGFFFTSWYDTIEMRPVFSAVSFPVNRNTSDLRRQMVEMNEFDVS